MTIVNVFKLSLSAAKVLSAWNTIPILAEGNVALTIPFGTKFIEVSLVMTVITAKTAAPDTPSKSTYPAIGYYRPTLQLATAIPNIVTNTILTPFGITNASSMTSTQYSMAYTVTIPIPASYATGAQSIQLVFAPEFYGSSASIVGWEFYKFSGTARCYA